MTKTVEITLYSFDELEGAAKEKAVQNYHNNWMQHEWWDSTYEAMKEEGEHKHGFRVDDIRFSGFWSQGDGASWCGAVNVREWIKSKPTEYQEHATTQIVLALIDEGWVDEKVLVSFSSSHYCHENTMDVSGISCTEPISDEEMESGMFKGANVAELIHLIDNTLDTLNERLERECKDFARTIYRELEADYEAQTTEEAIAETYNINDVWFHENGARA